jgi:AmmeMemoRadiSam system protein B
LASIHPWADSRWHAPTGVTFCDTAMPGPPTEEREPRVRPPSAAGLYYPQDATQLRGVLRKLLASTSLASDRAPKALIVPHAGYAYSGAVAASAFRTLMTTAGTIRHVVLLGPSHRVPMHGLAMPSFDYYATPCGDVPVDDAVRRHLRALGLAGIADAPHALEHAFEVQLPFLQAVLGEFDVLPVAAGLAPAGQVERALEAVWGGPETLIIVSSDLSHHRTHAEALALDRQTAEQILARSSDILDGQACGAACINGLMEAARHHALDVEWLDRGTSADTCAGATRVVGYGSFALFPSH